MWTTAPLFVWYVIVCLITYPATSIALGSVVLFLGMVGVGLCVYPSRQRVPAEMPIDCSAYDTDSLPPPQKNTMHDDDPA